jgi:hypothetical protein
MSRRPDIMLTLPALLGHADQQAEDRLTSKREDACQWMRERGIEVLSDPLPPERFGREARP